MDTDLLNQILPQADRQGFLGPSDKPNDCLVSTINTANRLLYLLAQREGMSTSQLAHHSKLNPNTCKCYMRKLSELGWIKKERAENSSSEAFWLITPNKRNEYALR